MLQFRIRSLVPPALVALLVVVPTARAKAEDPMFLHLQFATYELREAKEDVRNMKDVPEARRTKMLGAVDNAIDTLKKTIEAGGGKAVYLKPEDRDPNDFTQYRHIRHALKSLREAKKQVDVSKEIPQEWKDKANDAIAAAIEQLDLALEHAKK